MGLRAPARGGGMSSAGGEEQAPQGTPPGELAAPAPGGPAQGQGATASAGTAQSTSQGGGPAPGQQVRRLGAADICTQQREKLRISPSTPDPRGLRVAGVRLLPAHGLLRLREPVSAQEGHLLGASGGWARWRARGQARRTRSRSAGEAPHWRANALAPAAEDAAQPYHVAEDTLASSCGAKVAHL